MEKKNENKTTKRKSILVQPAWNIPSLQHMQIPNNTNPHDATQHRTNQSENDLQQITWNINGIINKQHKNKITGTTRSTVCNGMSQINPNQSKESTTELYMEKKNENKKTKRKSILEHPAWKTPSSQWHKKGIHQTNITTTWNKVQSRCHKTSRHDRTPSTAHADSEQHETTRHEQHKTTRRNTTQN